MKKLSVFVILFFLLVSLCLNPLSSEEQKKEPPQIKSVLTIEKSLFELTNKERKDRGLPLLSLSPGLSRIARQHSQDMSKRQKLSHLSSSGNSYEERLVEAGFYFISIGENVAFSETFVVEFIHKSLMESPEHRKNILGSDFDEVGIGVILMENEGYYITQDFLRSLEIKEEEVIQTEIQKKMNRLRNENSLPPLLFSKETDHYAREYSQKKAEGKPPPPLPSHFGETYITYFSSPSLDEIQSLYKEKILDRIYEKAGLGVSFKRNKDYPGGSYFMTLILFPENKYKHMKKDDLRKTVFLNLNEVRQKKGVAGLKLDKSLNTSAERVLKEIIAGRTHLSLPSGNLRQVAFLSYITEDPTLLPEDLEEQIEKDFVHYLRVGIGIIFRETKEFPRGAFWVTIFLER